MSEWTELPIVYRKSVGVGRGYCFVDLNPEDSDVRRDDLIFKFYTRLGACLFVWCVRNGLSVSDAFSHVTEKCHGERR